MEKTINLDNMLHRSKERIKNLGEVFTPEKYVDEMLGIISEGKKQFWCNEDISFFEPSCGHGNIVLPIIKKRYDAFLVKGKKLKINNPEMYAAANSLNTIWAIDIDTENVRHCRERVFRFLLTEIVNTRKDGCVHKLIENNFDYFSHLLCSVKWQIHENDALSSLANEKIAYKESQKTKMGSDWYRVNDHSPMEFDCSWVDYFRECDKDNLVPIDFERAQQFLVNILEGYSKGQSNFAFTKNILFPIERNNKLPLRGIA